MALEVHSAPSSYGTSRLSLRASRSSLRLARISCQNRKADPTIPGTAAAQPRRSMAGSSCRPGAAQARTTRTATSAAQAHSTALAAPTARLTGGPPPPPAVGNYSPAPPLDGVYHLPRLGGVPVELGSRTNEAGYHRLAPHALQDDQAGLVVLPKGEGRGAAAEPDEGHAAGAAPLAVVALRQVPHGQVEPHAFDPPHLDPIGPLGLQVRMPPQPADHVLRDVRLVQGAGPGGLEEPRPLEVREAQPPPGSPRDQQEVVGLRLGVRPAPADLEGEGGLELLGAVSAGLELPGPVGQGAGLGLLLGRPAGADREDAEGQHHPHQKGVLRSRTVHPARRLP